VSRSSSRLPRRLLAANEIFCDDPDAPLSPGRSALADQSNSFSNYMSRNDSGFPHPADMPSLNVLAETPRRKRRATISTRSPKVADENDIDTLASPSKRREKSRSQGNLDKHIRPMDKLEFDLVTGKFPACGTSVILLILLTRTENEAYAPVVCCPGPEPVHRATHLAAAERCRGDWVASSNTSPN
jgi:hypothetical protein